MSRSDPQAFFRLPRFVLEPLQHHGDKKGSNFIHTADGDYQ